MLGVPDNEQKRGNIRNQAHRGYWMDLKTFQRKEKGEKTHHPIVTMQSWKEKNSHRRGRGKRTFPGFFLLLLSRVDRISECLIIRIIQILCKHSRFLGFFEHLTLQEKTAKNTRCIFFCSDCPTFGSPENRGKMHPVPGCRKF